MKIQQLGIITALGATVIWAGNFIVARAMADNISPIDLNFWRWAIATICILPFTLKPMYNEWPKVWQHKWYILFMAFTGISLMNTLLYKAGQSTSSINMVLLFSCVPIFIMFFARIIFGEPITPRRCLGMLIILLGILSIISGGNIASILAVQFNAGDIWTLGAVLAFAIYSLYIRNLPAGISLSTFNGFTFLIGTLILLPIVLIDYTLNGLPMFNKNTIIGIMYVGIGCSVFAYVLWAKAISLIGPVKVGFIYYTVPFFTVTEAVLILDESFTFASIIGGICIIIGVLMATLEKKLPLRN